MDFPAGLFSYSVLFRVRQKKFFIHLFSRRCMISILNNASFNSPFIYPPSKLKTVFESESNSLSDSFDLIGPHLWFRIICNYSCFQKQNNIEFVLVFRFCSVNCELLLAIVLPIHNIA